MNASPIKAAVNDIGKACEACGARPRYPHTLGCTVAYPVFDPLAGPWCPMHGFDWGNCNACCPKWDRKP